MTLIVEARFSKAGTHKGVGRWRVYYRCEDMQEVRWRVGGLVPKAQIRVRDGRDVVVPPQLAEEFLAKEAAA